MSELILYTTEEGCSQTKLQAKGPAVKLSQRDMTEFFVVSIDNLNQHSIFEEGELNREASTGENLVVQAEGLLNAATRKWSAPPLRFISTMTSALNRTSHASADAELMLLENTLKKRPKP